MLQLSTTGPQRGFYNLIMYFASGIALFLGFFGGTLIFMSPPYWERFVNFLSNLASIINVLPGTLVTILSLALVVFLGSSAVFISFTCLELLGFQARGTKPASKKKSKKTLRLPKCFRVLPGFEGKYKLRKFRKEKNLKLLYVFSDYSIDVRRKGLLPFKPLLPAEEKWERKIIQELAEDDKRWAEHKFQREKAAVPVSIAASLGIIIAIAVNGSTFLHITSHHVAEIEGFSALILSIFVIISFILFLLVAGVFIFVPFSYGILRVYINNRMYIVEALILRLIDLGAVKQNPTTSP